MPRYEVRFEMKFTDGKIIIEADSPEEAEEKVTEGDHRVDTVDMIDTCNPPDVEVFDVNEVDEE